MGRENSELSHYERAMQRMIAEGAKPLGARELATNQADGTAKPTKEIKALLENHRNNSSSALTDSNKSCSFFKEPPSEELIEYLEKECGIVGVTHKK